MMLKPLLIAAVLAYTPTAEQIAACTPDVIRLCSAEIPNVEHIAACMKQKQNQISARCRAMLRDGKI